jgi:hypothetical protein
VPIHQPGVAEHAVDTRGTGRDDIGIEHHEGETAVAFQGIFLVEVDDRAFLPVFEPPVAGDPGVVLVDLAVAFLPVIELALANAQPGDALLGRQFGPL